MIGGLNSSTSGIGRNPRRFRNPTIRLRSPYQSCGRAVRLRYVWGCIMTSQIIAADIGFGQQDEIDRPAVNVNRRTGIVAS